MRLKRFEEAIDMAVHEARDSHPQGHGTSGWCLGKSEQAEKKGEQREASHGSFSRYAFAGKAT
jgi:hypothetical protein